MMKQKLKIVSKIAIAAILSISLTGCFAINTKHSFGNGLKASYSTYGGPGLTYNNGTSTGVNLYTTPNTKSPFWFYK